ncbi:hypothetical protein OAO60_01180 [bacterium]|nr:hypothetical protein [bacterium]
MNNTNNIYLSSFFLIICFLLFSIYQITHVINQYYLGVDIGDARLYLDAFFNKELNLNEDLGYTILLTYLGGIMSSSWLVTIFIIQSIFPILATFYLCIVLKQNGLHFNFFAVMLAATLWPFSLVFFADILKDPIIQSLLIFFVADTIKLGKKGFFYFLRFILISLLLFFLRPEFGILPIVVIIAFYIYNNFFQKKGQMANKLFLIKSLLFIFISLISLALIVELPNFATGRMGILSYGGNFSTFIYERSISNSLNYLPIYFGIFYLHPIGLPSGLSSMAVFLNNILIFVLVLISINRYRFIYKASSLGDMNARYLIYICGFFIFLHLIMALPVIIDSGGISVRHRLPSLYFLLIALILLSGIRARILIIIYLITLPLFLLI